MDLDEAKQRVATLSRELDARRPKIAQRLDYLRGKSGKLKYASEKFAEYNKTRYQGFSDNWCYPVATAPAERMSFLGVLPFGESEGFDAGLQRTWEYVDGDAKSSEAWLVHGAAARAFALVHPPHSPDGEPNLTFEHPESAIVDSDPVTGQDRDGLVTWIDGTNDYATYYTRDLVARFWRPSDREKWERTTSAVDLIDGWRALDDEPQINPLGEVPLAEMKNLSLLDDEPISDIDGVMALQDTMNLVWAYLLNGLDSASLPARVVTGADLPKTPIYNDNGDNIGTRDIPLDSLMMEKILWIPKEGASIDEWSAANLEVFWQVNERVVEHIAAQTRTPPHYLVAKMINTSAEALNVAEAGLVSKVGERIKRVTPAMKKVMRLLAKARGADQQRLINIQAGELIWDNIQYRSEAQLADAMGKLRSAGMPMRYIVERLVIDPAKVSRIMQLIEDERAADPLQMAQAAIRQEV